MFKDQYPHVYEIISKYTYMDDVMAGGHTPEESKERQDDLNLVLGKAGFKLKGFTVSGENPDESLTNEDGISISTFGALWFSLADLIGLDIKDMNFAKKHRGKKSATVSIADIIDRLTKRHCAAKVGEIFDLTGLVAPVIGAMKVDLHELNIRRFDCNGKKCER